MFFVTLRGNPVRIGNCTRSCKFQNFSLYCHCLYMDGKATKRKQVRKPANT